MTAVPAAVLLALAPGDTDVPPPPPPATLQDDAPRRSWSVPALHTAGVMLGMRVSLSVRWPRDFDPTRVRESLQQLRHSYTRAPDFRPHASAFEWDGDPWFLNTVGHGLFGAEVYTRSRQCGHDPLPSLLATTLASTAWEYGIESWHKQPSAQDLVWTPLAGALLGEGRFQLHRWLSTSHGGHPGAVRTVLMFVVDPLGELERRVLDTDC